MNRIRCPLVRPRGPNAKASLHWTKRATATVKWDTSASRRRHPGRISVLVSLNWLPKVNVLQVGDVNRIDDRIAIIGHWQLQTALEYRADLEISPRMASVA